MTTRRARGRLVRLGAATAALTLAFAASAAAAPVLPRPDATYVLADGAKCVSASATRPVVRNGISWAQRQLDYTSLARLSTGAGVNVWVIDSGVSRNDAFGDRLTGAFDFVVAADKGLTDCDGHGTMVAGIIAGAPSPSGFAGVAPGARIFSIRQSSSLYLRKGTENGNHPQTAGDPTTLARAITFAAQSGAQVINISEAACTSTEADEADIKYLRRVVASVIDKVVIVAAAGNVPDGACTHQNTSGVAPKTYAAPADIPGVLAVGAVDSADQPAQFTLAGPWVGVAAPGTNIIAPSPVGKSGEIDQVTAAGGSSPGPIEGTSFAAPYVAGLAALIRARFPALTPAEVIERIEQTAEHPAGAGGRDDSIGYGVIDPIAALTATIPGQDAARVPLPAPGRLPVAARERHTDHHAEVVALRTSIVVLLVGAGLGLVLRARRHTRRRGSG